MGGGFAARGGKSERMKSTKVQTLGARRHYVVRARGFEKTHALMNVYTENCKAKTETRVTSTEREEY